jgi:hypothetical protein
MPKRESIYSPFGMYAPDYAEVRVLDHVENFSMELEFTRAYRENLHQHVAIREARCLQVLFPKIFQPLRRADRLAGRISVRQIGFGLENASGGPGFYCYAENLWMNLRGGSSKLPWSCGRRKPPSQGNSMPPSPMR